MTRGKGLGPRIVRGSEEHQKAMAKASVAYSSGMTVREIAKKMGVSYGKAHRLIEESGVEMRPRGGSYA